MTHYCIIDSKWIVFGLNSLDSWDNCLHCLISQFLLPSPNLVRYFFRRRNGLQYACSALWPNS